MWYGYTQHIGNAGEENEKASHKQHRQHRYFEPICTVQLINKKRRGNIDFIVSCIRIVFCLHLVLHGLSLCVCLSLGPSFGCRVYAACRADPLSILCASVCTCICMRACACAVFLPHTGLWWLNRRKSSCTKQVNGFRIDFVDCIALYVNVHTK